MPVYRSLEEAHKKCVEQGYLIAAEKIDIAKVRQNLLISDEDLESANDLLTRKRWNSSYKLLYDALHVLVESLLSFDMVKSSNHQCLFAYLCHNHPELKLSWEFFEKLRTKRNGINYFAKAVSRDDFKEMEVQTKVYIQTIRTVINEKLLQSQ